MSRSLMVVAVLAAVVGAPAAIAQENARIGFVNTDRMLREAAPAKTAQTKLEQEFSRREKEIDDAGATLKTASERFEREAPTLSESQRQNRQRQLMDQDREFQRKRREFQEDLNSRKQEELQQILAHQKLGIERHGLARAGQARQRAVGDMDDVAHAAHVDQHMVHGLVVKPSGDLADHRAALARAASSRPADWT